MQPVERGSNEADAKAVEPIPLPDIAWADALIQIQTVDTGLLPPLNRIVALYAEHQHKRVWRTRFWGGVQPKDDEEHERFVILDSFYHFCDPFKDKWASSEDIVSYLRANDPLLYDLPFTPMQQPDVKTRAIRNLFFHLRTLAHGTVDNDHFCYLLERQEE